MSTHITCPGCGRRLILPSDCTAEVLSCPRCRTRIDNPQATGAAYVAQAEVPPIRQTTVNPSLSSWERGPRVADRDVDVTRHNRRPGCLTIVLPVIGGAGIAYALLSGVAMLGEGEARPLLVFLGVLTVLTFFSACGVAANKPRGSLGSNIGRTVLGVLTLSGVILGIGMLLSVVALIAVFAVSQFHPLRIGK